MPDKFALARENEKLRLQLRGEEERIFVKDTALRIVKEYLSGTVIPAEGNPSVSPGYDGGAGQSASNAAEAGQTADAGLDA